MNQDTKEALNLHRQLIRTKKFLFLVYKDLYQYFKKVRYTQGAIVEIGSGAGFIKEVMPKIITSDVIEGPDIDKVFFVEKMPFKNSSVAAFLMIDVLHHIKDPNKAFIEMSRCLKVGGKIIMVEPYNSIWGHLIYRYLHHEKFNPKASWKVPGRGRMSDSNTALPWIIFKRDRSLFIKKFPHLKITKFEPHSPVRYLISGGLTRWQFLPTKFYPAIKNFEQKLGALNKLLGMFVTIELEKTK